MAANVIRIKRSAVLSTPAALAHGEVAYSEPSKTLFIGITGGAIEAVAGAGVFAKLLSPVFTGTPQAPTPGATDDSDRIATTAFVKDQTITLTGDVTGSATIGNNIASTLSASGVTAGTYPKVTVDTKGRVTAGTSLLASDIPTLTASKISDFDTQVKTSRLDQMAAPTAVVNMNSQIIANVAAPTLAHHAANKAYVDAVREGLDWKDSVRLATTTLLASLSGLLTIDGFTVAAGDRVLVKDQTGNPALNGIYIAGSGVWARAADADSSDEVTPGMYCYVEQGTINGGSSFVLNTVAPITLGTTSLTFVQYNGAAQISAGNGLSKTGNQIDINVNSAGGIQIISDELLVKLNGATLTVDSNGLKVTDNTFQPLDADLTAIAAFSGNGLAARTGSGTWAQRSIVGTSGHITVTNGDAVSGSPTLDVGADVLLNTSDIDGGDF